MDASVRWMIFAAALGFCTAYALWGPSGAPAALQLPAPRPASTTLKASALKFEPTELDFGEVRVGELKTQTVRLHNPTTVPISINDIRGSCGCITLEMKQRDVPANGFIDVTVHYTGLSGSAKRDYGVTAHTGEFEHATASLPVHAQTVAIYNLEPALLYFDVKPGETEKTLTAKLKRNDGQPFNIRGADIRNKRLSLKWTPVNEARSEYELTCTLNASQIAAGVETMAVITDHPTQALVEIKASIRGSSSVAPMIPVAVGQWKAGTRQLFFSVPIQRFTPGTLEITDVKEGSNLAVTTELKRQSPAVLQVEIVITDPSVFTRQRRDGEFIIQTNVLPEPMRVPFTVPPPPAIQ